MNTIYCVIAGVGIGTIIGSMAGGVSYIVKRFAYIDLEEDADLDNSRRPQRPMEDLENTRADK